jgi:class 3 adenylate cyclase
LARRSGVLDIQSKLLIMLLAVSVVAALIVGAVSYVNARAALQDAAYQRVTALREARLTEIDRSFGQFTQGVVAASRNDSAINATNAFEAGWKDLQSKRPSSAQRASVDAWYSGHFIPSLEKQTGETANPDQFEPTTDPQTYLQANYTAPYTDFDKAIANDDAGDGSAWSKAHAQYQDYFRQLVASSGYDDILLMDTDSNVIYSAYSGADLGTNLDSGPYRDSNLAEGYEQALRLTSTDGSVVTDFADYTPSYGAPTLWVFSPVGDDGKIIGVMAVQVPVSLINSVMTGNHAWATGGLGRTGEAYVVGADKTMRSFSRALIQTPKTYEDDVVAAGEPPTDAALQIRDKSSVLLQRVDTVPVSRALQGKSGETIAADYQGKKVIAAYAPVEVDGLHWAVVAQIDVSEAFAPVNTLTRTIGLTIVGIIVLVSLLSLLLAQMFVRPIRRLQTAVQRITSGESGVEVRAKPGDEIGALGLAFNDMSRSLKVKEDLIEEQRRENDQLLATLMPQEVVKRYKQGDQTIAEEHQDVSVVYADIIGLDEFSRNLSAEESLALVNDVWRSFDEAASRIGIERVRTTRNGYLASCGLAIRRVDNARRVVEFTFEAQKIIDRFNAANSASIALRAGIDTGSVTSGLVGQSSLVYDLWGDAVNLAFRVQGVARTPGVYATQRVVDRLGDTMGMTESGTVETQTGPQRVWKLDRSGA